MIKVKTFLYKNDFHIIYIKINKMNIINIYLIVNFFLVSFFLIDKMICIPIILYIKKDIMNVKKEYEKTRWYLLHVFINILCVVTSFSGFYLSMKNIYTSLNPVPFAKLYTKEWILGPTSPLPTLIILSSHLYHMLFFALSNSDLYHHIFFAFSLTTINMIGDYGFARNVIPFVLCGLPGIIEYTIMSLYKFNFINKNMRYSVTIAHLFLRLPLGIMIFYSLLHQVFFNYNICNPISTSIGATLVFINVTQYCFENIKSSIKHIQKIEMKFN